MSLASSSEPNPRSLVGVAWHAVLVDATPAIRAEWSAFEQRGGALPLIEDLIDEHQGNEGPWRAGLLFHGGRRVEPLAASFPATMDAIASVPGLRSVLWSVLGPGTELPVHSGPNAGILRYHLGVSCGDGAALDVDGVVVPYRNGEGVLFDDTVPHSAWNRGTRRRVTLFCELERPVASLRLRLSNRMVQRLIALDPRYRRAPQRAAEWHAALNR